MLTLKSVFGLIDSTRAFAGRDVCERVDVLLRRPDVADLING